MKKQLLLFAMIFTFIELKAQYVTIPDAAFRSYLLSIYPSCFNAAQEMDTTCNAILTAKVMKLKSNVPNFNLIQNIEGLQYFKGLDTLWVDSIAITYLPAFPKRLKVISLTHVNITSLPSIPDSLTVLEVRNTPLAFLPPLPNTLTNLVSVYGSLTSLPSLPSTIDFLWCQGNNLTTLPPLPTQLYQMICDQNPLLYLPPLPNKLTSFSCNECSLNNIPALPPNMVGLYCNNNRLLSLPSLPLTLNYLSCGNNLLMSLPSLPSNLIFLSCGNNPFLFLPLLPPALNELNLFGANISCLPVLPSSLKYLTIDTNKIKCIPNSTSGLKVYPRGNHMNPLPNFPICNSANNINGCNAFPVIQGNIFYDLNSNGVKDANEYYKQHGRVNLSNGTYTFTNDSGNYQIAPDTIGTFTLSTNTLSFFNAIPAMSTFSFTTYDTSVIQNIALQPSTVHDSLGITLTPVMLRARPGLPFTYVITYENAGSTNLPLTNVIFHYDSSILTFNSSTNVAITNTGNSLILNLSSLPAGSFDEFNANFVVKTSAPSGDTVVSEIIISSGAIIFSDTSRTIITASFDPNDKDATPMLTPEQVSNGTYIDYVIRFQNTGTDTAFHVVIADTLSSLLQANTFEVVSTSHSCITTVKNNVVTFEMRNIMLPDVNVNEPASHGFIRFRIKPISTIIAGNSVNNKAAIYFDYNTPTITNIAVTQIASHTLPLKLISFKGKRTESGSINLYWQTNNEINIKLFTIEQSIKSREFSKIAEVRSIGYGNNDYTHNITNPTTCNLYFRLKIFDKDGTFTYSPVILIKDNIKAGFTLRENPVQNEIVLSSITPSLLYTEGVLVNNIGVVVKRFIIHLLSQTILVNDLSSGMYYLKTVQGNKKVIISR